MQNDKRDEPSFADPSKRIRRTVNDMKLPAQVELVRSRLPPSYAPKKPLYDNTVSTPHAIEVLIAAVLAITDGKMSDMQDAADVEAMARLTSAMEAARALGDKPDAEGAKTASAVDVEADPPIRIGHGYDIHQMATRDEAGQPMVIGGVRFDGSDAPDFELGCVANSDGDVIYHSVVDAVLGALTMPDIGQLFPDGKGSQWAGADSEVFMVEAYERMSKRGYTISNVDVTVICEKPRLNVDSPRGGKVKQMMMDNVARLMHIDPSRVNVKARTHEKVDSVGECRALECHAVLIMERPSDS